MISFARNKSFPLVTKKKKKRKQDRREFWTNVIKSNNLIIVRARTMRARMHDSMKGDAIVIGTEGRKVVWLRNRSMEEGIVTKWWNYTVQVAGRNREKKKEKRKGEKDDCNIIGIMERMRLSLIAVNVRCL